MDQPSDIRNLSAHRPVSTPVVELRSPAQLRPELRDAIEPARRRFGTDGASEREDSGRLLFLVDPRRGDRAVRERP